MSSPQAAARAATLSRSLQQDLVRLRQQFHPYVVTWDALHARRRDLAAPLMAAYRRWHRETGRTFVAFVQQLDPTVPGDKAGYGAHRSYHAALYLRRLVEAPGTLAGQHQRHSLTPLATLAVVLKSVLPLVRPHEAQLWTALARTTGWHTRDLERLQRRVRRARAFPVRPDQPRLVPRDTPASREVHVH